MKTTSYEWARCFALQHQVEEPHDIVNLVILNKGEIWGYHANGHKEKIAALMVDAAASTGIQMVLAPCGHVFNLEGGDTEEDQKCYLCKRRDKLHREYVEKERV